MYWHIEWAAARTSRDSAEVAPTAPPCVRLPPSLAALCALRFPHIRGEFNKSEGALHPRQRTVPTPLALARGGGARLDELLHVAGQVAVRSRLPPHELLRVPAPTTARLS